MSVYIGDQIPSIDYRGYMVWLSALIVDGLSSGGSLYLTAEHATVISIAS